MDSAIKCLDSLALSSKDLGVLVKAFVERGNRIQFRAKGNSMFPCIKDGESVIVVPYGGTPPGLGDIVAFMDYIDRKLILHRIIRISGDEFITKGDNCFHMDIRQPRENILGYIQKTNSRRHSFCCNNYTKYKKCITFFSRLGITAITGSVLKRIDNLISMS